MLSRVRYGRRFWFYSKHNRKLLECFNLGDYIIWLTLFERSPCLLCEGWTLQEGGKYGSFGDYLEAYHRSDPGLEYTYTYIDTLERVVVEVMKSRWIGDIWWRWSQYNLLLYWMLVVGKLFNINNWVDGMIVSLTNGKGQGRRKFIARLFWISLLQWVKIKSSFCHDCLQRLFKRHKITFPLKSL